MTLLRWLTFQLRSHTVIPTVLLFWMFLFLLILVFVLQWLSLCWKILIMLLSIAFPSNSQQDAPFHCIAYDYSCADWGSFQDHLRYFPCKDIFKSVLLLLQVNFMGGFRLESMYISLIKSIRSSLIRLPGFHLLVLMP